MGRGAADMKGALAVMLEVADALAAGRLESDLDVGLLFFGREELPITESALLPLFERCPLARTPDLAVVMEPTDNAIQVGCLGNLERPRGGARRGRAQRTPVAGRQRDPHGHPGARLRGRPADPRRGDRRARPTARW